MIEILLAFLYYESTTGKAVTPPPAGGVLPVTTIGSVPATAKPVAAKTVPATPAPKAAPVVDPKTIGDLTTFVAPAVNSKGITISTLVSDAKTGYAQGSGVGKMVDTASGGYTGGLAAPVLGFVVALADVIYDLVTYGFPGYAEIEKGTVRDILLFAPIDLFLPDYDAGSVHVTSLSGHGLYTDYLSYISHDDVRAALVKYIEDNYLSVREQLNALGAATTPAQVDTVFAAIQQVKQSQARILGLKTIADNRKKQLKGNRSSFLGGTSNIQVPSK